MVNNALAASPAVRRRGGVVGAGLLPLELRRPPLPLRVACASAGVVLAPHRGRSADPLMPALGDGCYQLPIQLCPAQLDQRAGCRSGR